MGTGNTCKPTAECRDTAASKERLRRERAKRSTLATPPRRSYKTHLPDGRNGENKHSENKKRRSLLQDTRSLAELHSSFAPSSNACPTTDHKMARYDSGRVAKHGFEAGAAGGAGTVHHGTIINCRRLAARTANVGAGEVWNRGIAERQGRLSGNPRFDGLGAPEEGAVGLQRVCPLADVSTGCECECVVRRPRLPTAAQPSTLLVQRRAKPFDAWEGLDGGRASVGPAACPNSLPRSVAAAGEPHNSPARNASRTMVPSRTRFTARSTAGRQGGTLERRRAKPANPWSSGCTRGTRVAAAAPAASSATLNELLHTAAYQRNCRARKGGAARTLIVLLAAVHMHPYLHPPRHFAVWDSCCKSPQHVVLQHALLLQQGLRVQQDSLSSPLSLALVRPPILESGQPALLPNGAIEHNDGTSIARLMWRGGAVPCVPFTPFSVPRRSCRSRPRAFLRGECESPSTGAWLSGALPRERSAARPFRRLSASTADLKMTQRGVRSCRSAILRSCYPHLPRPSQGMAGVVCPHASVEDYHVPHAFDADPLRARVPLTGAPRTARWTARGHLSVSQCIGAQLLQQPAVATLSNGCSPCCSYSLCGSVGVCYSSLDEGSLAEDAKGVPRPQTRFLDPAPACCRTAERARGGVWGVLTWSLACPIRFRCAALVGRHPCPRIAADGALPSGSAARARSVDARGL